MMDKDLSRIEEVPYCFSRSSVKFQGYTSQKIVDLDPNWAFPDCNSSLNSPMATKWCKKLAVALRRCPIVFQGHPSNFKVTWDKKKIVNFDPHWCFQTVTPVWIHWWIWNDAQSLMRCPIEEVPYWRGALLKRCPIEAKSFNTYWRGALLFFGDIHQIARSRRLKNRRFGSNLSKTTRPVAAIKSLRFALFYYYSFVLGKTTKVVFVTWYFICSYYSTR